MSVYGLFDRKMTDYDAAAHISEEVKKASIAAPVAIFVAVIGTGVSAQALVHHSRLD